MRLYHHVLSPYVRKVMVSAIEMGVDDRIERIEVSVGNVAETVGADNPLGTIPTLVLDDGTPLYDSRAICEYLDTLHGGLPLFPPNSPDRWRALRYHSLGDGILDLAVAARNENTRAAGEKSEAAIEKRLTAIRRALDALEEKIEELEGPLTIGTIAVGVALGYLDFRFEGEFRQHARAGLMGWFERFNDRPAMRATAPA